MNALWTESKKQMVSEEAKSGVKSAQNKQVTKSVPKKKIYRKRFVWKKKLFLVLLSFPQ